MSSATWSGTPGIDGTLGRFQNTTSYYKQFVGIFSLFEIWESTTSWDHSSTTKANLLISQLDLYENYWDLTQGTTFDGFVSKNPCKRRRELNISDVYFTHKSTEQPPFPTSQGWFSLYPNTWVFAENVDLSNTHQFTVEFEYYPIEYYYQIQFHLYNSSTTNYMRVYSKMYYSSGDRTETWILNPSYSSTYYT